MVECFYDGTIIRIPEDLFFSSLTGKSILTKKYVRYKDGAKMYGMSERSFYELVRDAEAIYKRNGMVLVNVEILDKFMEFFHE